MSTEKTIPNKNKSNINNIIRKKRNNEFDFKVIDPIILKTLDDTYIQLVQKCSSNCPLGRFICRICSSHMIGSDKAIKHSNDVTHKNNFKKTYERNMMKFLPKPTDIQYNAIDICLKDTLKMDIFISDIESDRRKVLCNEMNTIVSANGSKLIISGSLATGLSMVNVSDVNLYLDLSSKAGSYFSELKKLSVELTEKLHLKVEIKLEKTDCGLFCKDSQGILYHISNTTRMCQLTSTLLEVYMKIDERAEKLIRIFRYFANQAFIDRTNDGLLQVQVFSLLVVYYLQHLAIPILPNLHKLANFKLTVSDSSVTSVTVNDTVVRYVSDLTVIRSLWTPPSNTASLAELWVGMLRFYTIDFDSAQYMVSICCSEPVLKIDRNIKNNRLAVEDPFDKNSNLLFDFYSPDAVDFFNEQMQRCYLYFAVPQLSSGPAFSIVKFREITAKTLAATFLVTPTFSHDNFTVSVELMETLFRNLYKAESSSYDVTKWPVSLFVKSCLSMILTSVFDTRPEIDSLLMLTDIKNYSTLTITNYGVFKGYAMTLAMRVFEVFSTHFEDTGTWTHSEINTKDAINLVRKAAQKFVTESLNMTITVDNDEDINDVNDEEFEMRNKHNSETDIDEIIEDAETILRCDEDDSAKPCLENCTDTKTVKCTESWKIPISFQLICVPKKGMEESSTDIGVYNEHRINSLELQQLQYSFLKMPIVKKKLEVICALCKVKGHRKESCRDAVPKFDELKFVLRDVKQEWLSKLSVLLIKKYNSIVPSPDRQQIHGKIFADIKQIIKQLYPTSEPQLFGSSNNGFMTRMSDLDICMELFYDDNRRRLSNKEIATILKTIATELRSKFREIDLQLILSAKVPIIKFYFPNNVHGDISVNNILGVENSKMLKLYCELYGNLKVLGNLVKFMSKSCEIGDASQGTLSSYAYIVLLIHFLQKRSLLPVLQELYETEKRPINIIDGWNAWYQSDLDTIKKLWKPKATAVSLEYLWLDFFYYYTVEFNIDREVVSIKQSQPLFKIDKGWTMSYLAIEDPFNLGHNLGRSLSVYNFRYILVCFAHVLKLHSNNENLNRKENAHSVLMEPSSLRPSNNDLKLLNQKSHEPSESNDNQNKRTNTKSGHSESEELPKLTAPFLFKESTKSNQVYIETDNSVSALNALIRLKSFTGTIDDFSVLPISLNFGNKSIVIPMLMGKDDRVADKMNNLFENGYKNSCSLQLEVTGNNAKSSEIVKQTPRSIDTVDTPRNNSAQHSKPHQEDHNGQARPRYGPITNPNIIPNPVRLMATNPNYGNSPRQPGYRFPQQYQYGPQTQDRGYYDYQRMQMNGRQVTNPRFASKGNK